MSLSRMWTLMARDLRMGPRAPVIVWVLLMPVIITFLLQVVLLSLFKQQPRLGIADLGSSQITAAVEQMEGIELTRAQSRAELRALVEKHHVDAGVVLAPEFDRAVREGEKPKLEIYVSGESLASNRLVLAVTAIDLVRRVEDRPAPVQVALKNVGGGEPLPIEDIVVLGIMIFVLLVTGVFVPAFMVVEEREHRTLVAMLVTPVNLPEVLLAKGVLGFFVTIVMCLLTLALNGALPADLWPLLVTLAVATLTFNQIGLLFATLAEDTKTLYTIQKSTNLLLIGPFFLYFFPSAPQWIAKLFPTYWCIDPLYQVALRGATLEDVGHELAVALLIAVALSLPVVLLGRRLEAKLA